MKLHAVEAGNFKLDGGAMFGVVPKSIWTRTNPADSNNMIDIAARCLLIEDGDRLILIDNGMGDKQSEKFFGYYYRWGDHNLSDSLNKLGFSKDDVTDVFLTHLHFDHCGGSVAWNDDRSGYKTAFKNATYWSNKDHWTWATQPNRRERASFLKENIMPIEESGQLKFVSKSQSGFVDDSELGFGIFFADGHTDKQMIPLINYKGKTLAFMADLLPTAGHLPIPFVMGYDTRPLLTLDEKTAFLDRAVKEDFHLFLEHDAHNPIISLKQTEKGVRMEHRITINEYFN